jgi:c-di-GMP-binding flagellar brake protein YcgR
MTQADLRRHQRILVPGAVKIRVETNGAGPRVEGVATVIGLGGMFVRTQTVPPPGSVLRLGLIGPSISLESECTVRHVADNGIGVEFTRITPGDEQRLKRLLLQLKN